MCCDKDQKIIEELKNTAKENVATCYKILMEERQELFSPFVIGVNTIFKWHPGTVKEQYYLRYKLLKWMNIYEKCTHGIHVYIYEEEAKKQLHEINNKLGDYSHYVIVPVQCNIKDLIIAGFNSTKLREKIAVFSKVTVNKEVYNNVFL
jgi:hypothetical protein